MKKKTTLNFALAMCSEQRVNKVSNGTTMITTIFFFFFFFFFQLVSSSIANKRRAHKSYAPGTYRPQYLPWRGSVKNALRYSSEPAGNPEKSGNTASRKRPKINFAQTREAK
jgi:hypothetical protein